MALSDIVTAVGARLAQRGVTAEVAYGGHHTREHGAPPRVVFVPRSESAGPAEGLGGNPRRLFTRVVQVDVHVWAVDADAAEALHNSVAAAIYAEAHGAFAFLGAEWPELNDDWASLGTLIIARYSLKVPVTDPPHQTVVVETTTQSVTLASS